MATAHDYTDTSLPVGDATPIIGSATRDSNPGYSHRSRERSPLDRSGSWQQSIVFTTYRTLTYTNTIISIERLQGYCPYLPSCRDTVPICPVARILSLSARLQGQDKNCSLQNCSVVSLFATDCSVSSTSAFPNINFLKKIKLLPGSLF